MFDNSAITWVLTALLLLSGSYHVVQAVRSRHLTVQANQSLHAFMNIVMTAMLWQLVPTTMLAQIAVLAGAALWFVLQAVARPEFQILCAGSQSRLRCIYHSLTMAGAAFMLAMMGMSHLTSGDSAPAQALSIPVAHHHTPGAVYSPAAPGFGHSVALMSLPAAFFAAAAVVFLVLLLRMPLQKNTPRTALKPSVRIEHGLEATSATIMALMFATMTA